MIVNRKHEVTVSKRGKLTPKSLENLLIQWAESRGVLIIFGFETDGIWYADKKVNDIVTGKVFVGNRCSWKRACIISHELGHHLVDSTKDNEGTIIQHSKSYEIERVPWHAAGEIATEVLAWISAERLLKELVGEFPSALMTSFLRTRNDCIKSYLDAGRWAKENELSISDT